VRSGRLVTALNRIEWKAALRGGFLFCFYGSERNKASLRSLALFDHRCGKEVPHKSQKADA
jgi:hypothetical protein